MFIFFFLWTPPPPPSTLFPYTTLFRSRSALALRAETEIFEKQYRVDRERVVELDDIDVLRRQARHRIGLFAAGERASDGQIRHARNIGVRDRLAAAEHIDGRLVQRAGALGGRQDDRAAAIGHE